MKRNKKSEPPPRVAQIRAPKGFSFDIQRGENSYYNSRYREVNVRLLRKSQGEIGSITLESYDGGKSYATHSSLDYEYRGQGLGALIYARAIQWCLVNKAKVSSSGGSSEDAKRVWNGKTLRKHFKLRKITHSRSHSYTEPKWFAYAKAG